jgi:SAM-dependent methyltransferase
MLAEPLLPRLRAAADVEGKVVRALEALGPLAGREAGFVDLPDGSLRDRLTQTGIDGIRLPLSGPLAFDRPDASLDAVVTLWTAFRGVDERDLREVDRVLRPSGRLLVVHDYGRDDVSLLGNADAPEYRLWSRRDGPFLAGAGFKVRVVHCFWTFTNLEEARGFLVDAFGEPGATMGASLKRPRLSWNVAVYHRWRGGVTPR